MLKIYFREALAFKAQGSELAEAERLEREALMRRERAVAHGMRIIQFNTSSSYNMFRCPS
jgi:hypothetical protein